MRHKVLTKGKRNGLLPLKRLATAITFQEKPVKEYIALTRYENKTRRRTLIVKHHA